MDDRGDLLRAITAARNGQEQAEAVAALDAHDRRIRSEAALGRELDMGAVAIRERLDPVPLFEHHTAATDWLGDYDPPADYRTAMIAQASAWYRSVPREVREDGEELAEQARLRAYTAASAYGDMARIARGEFLTCIAYLAKGAASGLPQIDQTIDPNNQPSATPYPTEVFDNFAPEENEYNGVESPNHQSGISSEQAPMLQQIQQQDGSGSGYGSGPERPDEHDTAFDTSLGYAEVPLGPPGVIPTGPQGIQPPATSAPNPNASMTGQQDDDDDAPQMRSASLTAPDAQGYRWSTAHRRGEPIDSPFHEVCASLHWPGQRCRRSGEHVAVSYATTLEDYQSQITQEWRGFSHGARLAVPGNARTAARHHDEIITAFAADERTPGEVAWLHGYLAAVRPMLAAPAPAPVTAASDPKCTGCGKAMKPGKAGLCKACRKSA
jgi:hypothetical protein